MSFYESNKITFCTFFIFVMTITLSVENRDIRFATIFAACSTLRLLSF